LSAGSDQIIISNYNEEVESILTEEIESILTEEIESIDEEESISTEVIFFIYTGFNVYVN